MPEKGYIVIYEEDDTGPGGDDGVVVDVDLREEADDVIADFAAKVTNRANPLAVWGLALALAGAAANLVAIILFAIDYPTSWYPAAGQTADSGYVQLVAGLAALGTLLLIVGNLLVGFGRQLHAHGVLQSLRFVPRSH